MLKQKKKNDEIEVLELYPEKKSKLKKIKLNKKFTLTLIGIFAVFILVGAISLITKTNIIVVATQKILYGLGIYTTEVKNVEITSTNYNEPGSWNIDKSAKWIGYGKARVTFDVNSIMKTGDKYKDVILVLDISGSMDGEKLEKAKSDSKELINYLLSDSHNRVALITFETGSTIVSEFSNDKALLLEKVSSLSVAGTTNYNAALQNVNVVMEGYTKEANRNIVTLFLTDGYPCEDTPNQIGTYEILKDKYPYMSINGIQYEMGTEITQKIKEITDAQWVADQSTLNNVLFDASISPTVYEEYSIIDYINNDYFTIESANDIKVSMGEASLTEEAGTQKIIWNLGKNSYMTGSNAKMTINLTLKEAYKEISGYYPTNTKEIVTSKLPEEESKKKNSTSTPVLKSSYQVIYDTNKPSGCHLEEIPPENHLVYSNVTKSSDKLTCNGYLFKGWEIDENDEKDIKKVNDDVFIMPEHDVTIRGTWTRQNVVKSMDGTVHEKTTLYKVLQNAAEEGTYAKEYTGAHQDSMDASKSTQKIYHWYTSDQYDTTKGNAILDKNNVIFAGKCWQMIRTTDTGGVKMVYNGEAEDGKCLNTRGAHIGYGGYSPRQNLTSNYWYGTDYTYDKTAKTFKVSGTTEQTIWDATTGPGLIGKYTCKLTDVDGTCSTLYLVESYYNASSAYVISLDSNSHYSQFGTLPFNANYNSPTYVGYMYGDVYPYSTVYGTTSQSFTKTENMLSSSSLSTSYWYADEIELDPSTGKYSLVNPYQVSATSEYPSLVGKYTFRSSSETSMNSYVYYIAVVNNTTMYYKQLQNKNLLSAYSPIQFGDSITDNGDGTYTLINPKEVTLKEWYTDYANYKNQYTCGNSSTNCAAPRYTTATTSTNYTYINAGEKILIAKGRDGLKLTDTLIVRQDEWFKNYRNYSDYKYTCNTESDVCTESTLRMITGYSTTGYNYAPNHYYGSSVTWDGTNYTLVDPIEIENYNNLDNLSTHHYICTSYGEKSCTNVGYVYYYTGSGSMYYITLKNGVTTVDKALEDMFTKNTTNSTMKSGVEAWYKKHLLAYDDYLEDTIFCNDRSMSNKERSGWNPNGGKTNTYLYFKEVYLSSDLSCQNITDQFSVSNEKAKLTYKVGLMSSSEINILNNDITRKTGGYYWLASPYYFHHYAYGRYVYSRGNLSYSNVDAALGARPAVSLKPGTEYSSGDGSMENPYVVDLTSGHFFINPDET